MSDSEATETEATCPVCGNPISYCQGHGELGDPAGYRIMKMHDNGDHSECADRAECVSDFYDTLHDSIPTDIPNTVWESDGLSKGAGE